MIPKPKLITDLIVDSGSGALVATSTSGHGVFAVSQNMTQFGNKPDEPLEALDASITLNIDGASSSASIRLPQGTNIDGRAYIKMYTVQGFAGIFRTRSPQIGFGGNSTTLQLEHAINELGDYIIAEKIVAKKKMSLKSALQKIFKYYHEKSNLWTLGDQIDNPADTDIEDWEVDCVLEADYDNCLDVLESVMEQYPTMMLEFDFGSRPWKLNVRNRPRVVTAEGRLARNVKSAMVTRDDSELFTRVYMDGYKNKDGKYGSYTSTSSKNKYGLIETVISGANDTAEIAQRTVKSYMRNHKNPKISVTIDAIDLCNITGETFDRFSIGKLCRLALPDYGETVSETLTSLAFPSIYKSPNSCTVTLNSEEDRVIKYIKKAQKSASKAGKAAASVGKAAVMDFSVSNNILTLKKGDGTEINFSKATLLETDPSDNKGWKGGKYTVRAYQNNKNTTTGNVEKKEVAAISTQIHSIALQNNKSPSVVNNKYIQIPLKVTFKNGTYVGNTEYTQTYTTDATPVWNKGFDTAAGLVKPPSYIGSTVKSDKFNFQVPITAGQSRTSATIKYQIAASAIPSSSSVANVYRLNDAGTSVLGTVARIDVGYIFDFVSITYLGLAKEYSALGNSAGDVRSNIFIETDISNGKKINNKLLTLASTKYASNTMYCVNLKDGNDIIGRINVDSVYTDGWNDVTVSSIGLASNYSPLGSSAGDTRTNIFVQATASNGKKKDDKLFTLAKTTYNSGNSRCVNLKDGSDVIGRINIDSVYEDGVDDGKAYYNKNATIYLDSKTYYQGQWVFMYRQTVSQESQGIIQTLDQSRVVRWHA